MRLAWHMDTVMLTGPSDFIVAMPMNCSGMYRGVVYEDGVPKTAIFDDDDLD